MSLPNELHPLQLGAGSAAAYEIEQSLRFDGTGRLSRSMGAGSRTTATISCWIKSDFYRTFFIDAAGGSSNSLETTIYMSTSSIGVGRYDSSWGQVNGSNRDPAAWYHVMWVLDTNNSTGSDRIRVYVNGVRRTFSFSTTPSQGENLGWNNSAPVYIGHRQQIPTSSGDYYWGYLAEMHHVDGTALNPTDFGEFDDNGVWRPIEVSGLTYGTNGFYLKFDPSAANGIGHDHSGNGNNFTPTGFTTSGTGTDVMDDTPTTNWCTGNPLAVTSGDGVWTSGGGGNGNLSAYCDNTRGGLVTIPCPNSGKWYCEITPTTSTASGGRIGLSPTSNTRWVSNNGDFSDGTYNGYAYDTSGNKVSGGTSSSYGASYGANDVIGIAFDAGGGTLTFYKNGTSQGTAFTSISTNENWVFAFRGASGSNFVVTLNFGQRDFAYTPPSGFSALNTANLPAPDIADGSQYFNTVTYSGDSNTATTISGVGFQPDFVWIKNRSLSGDDYSDHMLFDVIRGVKNYLSTNRTNQETNNPVALQEFTVDGFRPGSMTRTNETGSGFVAWNWLAGGSGSSNTSGSITSTVSANPSAGFSIVSYTGNGVNGATIGHGLGVEPAMIIVKERVTSPHSGNWFVWHKNLPSQPANFNLNNDTSSAPINATGQGGMASAASNPSSVFQIYTGVSGVENANRNTATYIAYCFAEVEGYSKFGSYTGNGSTDGPFVYCGFKPAWIMYKRSSASGGWYIYDAERSPANGDGLDKYLKPHLSAAEDNDGAYNTTEDVDLLSNGFKIRDGGGDVNVSGATYIFACLASSPFGGSGVSPATAR